MRKLALVVAGAAGFAVSLLGGHAFAAPTCTSFITVSNGQLVPDTSLGSGVCVNAVDKTYGNFKFGNLPAGGSVLFSWTGVTTGTHTEEFVGQLTAGTTYSGVGFEVDVNALGAGLDITQLNGDFDQTNPAAATSTLTKNGVTCTRDPTTCPLTIKEPDITDLIDIESLALGSGADTAAIINSVTEAATTHVPEPMSLALLGGALVGFGVIRRRKNT